MKKTYSILLALFTLFVAVGAAQASTVQFTPLTVDVKAGQTFTMNVAINTQGVKNYTSKIVIDFPANVLKINSFTFNNAWMPITLTGYDAIDNTNGTLTKSAGYPGGFSNTTVFGTISFTAKKEGSGSMSVTGDSLSMGSSGQNLLTPTAPVTITVAAAPVPTPSATTLTPSTTETPATQNETPSTTNDSTTTPVDNVQSAGQASLLGSVMHALSFGTDLTWLAVLVALIIIGALWYGIYFWQTKRTKTTQTNSKK